MDTDLKELRETAEAISMAIADLIEYREQIPAKLLEVTDDVERQEIGVNISKGVSVAGTVISTALLFTPLAPFGVAGLATSAAVQVGTTIADLVMTKAKTNDVQDILAFDQAACQELTSLLSKFDTLHSQSMSACTFEGFSAVEITKATAEILAGTTSGGGAVAVLIGTRQVADLTLKGASSLSTASISSVSTAASGPIARGVEVSLAATETTATAMKSASAVVSTIGRSLCVAGAVVSVADFVWSVAKDNPTIEQIRNVRNQVDESSEHLAKIETNVSIETLKVSLIKMAQLMKMQNKKQMNLKDTGLVIIAGDSNLRRLLSPRPHINGGKAWMDNYLNQHRLVAVYAKCKWISHMIRVLEIIMKQLPELVAAFKSVKVVVCTGWYDFDDLFWDSYRNVKYSNLENLKSHVNKLIADYQETKGRFEEPLITFVYSHNRVYDNYVSGKRRPRPIGARTEYKQAAERFATGLQRIGVSVFRAPPKDADMDETPVSDSRITMCDGHLGPKSEPLFAQWLIDHHLSDHS